MNHPILNTTNLTIGYKTPRGGTRIIVADICASLIPGELVCLLGANGAGKSTLLRTLGGMQPPIQGTVELLGNDIYNLAPQELAKLLSLVLTEKIDVGMLCAETLVSMGRYPYTNWWGNLTEKDEKIVHWAMASVGSLHLAKRNVNQLSDGERQKIMIARALAQEPALMLLDEPTAFLDLPRRVEIMQLLRQLAQQTNQAILLSTHDLDLALRLADKIWLLTADGSLEIGAPEDLVLNGIFTDTFQSEGVEFDVTSGEFRLHTPIRGEISLVGGGIEALWTKRALQRVGFVVVSHSNSSIRVEVVNTMAEDDLYPSREGHANGVSRQLNWQVKYANAVSKCQSIYELIQFLERITEN